MPRTGLGMSTRPQSGISGASVLQQPAKIMYYPLYLFTDPTLTGVSRQDAGSEVIPFRLDTVGTVPGDDCLKPGTFRALLYQPVTRCVLNPIANGSRYKN